MLKQIFPEKFDLRYYWLLVGLFIAYLASGRVNTPEYSLSVACAFIAAGFVFHAVQYNFLSFISLLVVGHIVQYPLAAFIILVLPSADLSIEPELWTTTPASMWVMSLSMMGLLTGVYLAKLMNKPFKKYPGIIHQKMDSEKNWITPVWFNTLLVLSGIPVVLFYISNGLYYHKNVGVEYNYDAASTFGFLGYIIYITYIGAVLQLKRYMTEKTKKDLVYLIILNLMLFVMYAPSGGRRFALLPLVISFFFYLKFETDNKRKKALFLLSAIGLTISLPVMEAYRNLGAMGASGFWDRVSILFDFLTSLNVGSEEESGSYLIIFGHVLGRRLADYISVGYIMDVIPKRFDFTGFDDLVLWPAFIAPTLLRPDVNLSFTYDALVMEEIGFRPISITGGSSPMMLIGDLYARMGLTGVIIGMIIIGFILTKFDIFLSKGTFRRFVVLIFMMENILSLHSYPLLKFFVLFTRHFFIYYIIASILEIFLFEMKKIGEHSRLIRLTAKC